MWFLVAGLFVFLGIHSTRMLAPAWRESFIEARGEAPWKGMYTITSIAGMALLVWGYGQARFDNVFLYASPVWLSHLQLLLMVPVMILLVASNLPAGRIKKAVKNPMLIAIKIWAIGHILVNGDLASLLLFGTFLIWAVFLVINTNRRNEPRPETVSVRSDVISVVAGVIAWVVFIFWLHEVITGVPAIA
ncbi:MAG: NnrU family protein [Pseudomonadota bacterium]